jgi:hypothetical protein
MVRRTKLCFAITVLGLLKWGPEPVLGADPQKPPASISSAESTFFESKIRPVFADNCFKCHGETKQKGSLRLDSLAGMLAGGDQGPVLVPGKPEQSLFIKAIGYAEELKMPPTKKLPPQQIADLTHWVKMGAPWPGANPATPSTTRRSGFQVTEKDRSHWSFQPIKRPTVPVVKNQAWLTNPIDAFILAQLEAGGLQPNPPALKTDLLRRVYYDLTGLPPTPQEVDEFLTDPSPTAYEVLIDRLLASPRYGEKWGRHWLDLVRFAETNSYERDNPKPNAWRFRDYVIRSFNQDKPYDQFIREQLAGDEWYPLGSDAPVSPGNAPSSPVDAITATGYYRLGIWDDEPSDRDQARYDGLDDIVATTGQVFLGLTLDCARCHDHKIDPIPQKDYYSFLAFFNNINHYRNGGRTDEVRLISDAAGGQSYLALPEDATDKAEPKKKKKPDLETILCVTETAGAPVDTFVLLRGNPNVKGDMVEPAFPQVLGSASPVIPKSPSKATTSGRRLVLANWIASKENQLTARVMVNRLWQYHFGRGIVRSPNNFGLQGDKPTHPELLDWLAAELIANGWRLKPLHRLITTSSAYRMSSRTRPDGLTQDPINDLFWRFDMRRLSAEEVRDSLLAITQTLNLKMFGPGIYPEIPKEVLAGQSRPGDGWGKSPPVEQARRSVYIHVKRSLLTPILERFDVAETDRSSAVRFATTQPTQALTMLNSEFLNQQAEALALRLRREAGNEVDKQVDLALRLATARSPTKQEIRRGLDLIETLRTRNAASPEAALKYFCLMVLNLNELVYLD